MSAGQGCGNKAHVVRGEGLAGLEAANAEPADLGTGEIGPLRLERTLVRARAAQAGWAAFPIAERLRVIHRLRRAIAGDPRPLLRAFEERRPPAESLSAEILPLLDAARFLEREAGRLLAPRRPPGSRPLWLAGVRSEIRRHPFGLVLILAPSNYPLMLPGIQALQALAAGNAVCIKPAPSGEAAMVALARVLTASGLPDGVFAVLDSAAENGLRAIAAGVDKIVLTGSAETGARVLAAAAPRLTPATMELSGCDAAFVLEGADLELVYRCLTYGLRLNGGATCIAPRRVFVAPHRAADFAVELSRRLASVPAVRLSDPVAALVDRALAEATAAGARVLGARNGNVTGPIVVVGGDESLRVAREDIFAPLISVIASEMPEAALAADRACPYALGASVFGPTGEAVDVARRLRAGSVVVNDIIVPTADPRLPFGGRAASGFGVTRGAEGLLEMTAIQALSVRRGGFRLHLRPPASSDEAALTVLLAALHAGTVGLLRTVGRIVRSRRTPRPVPR